MQRTVVLVSGEARPATEGVRQHLTPAELAAVGIAAVATIGFGAYGAATGAPSTGGYVLSIIVLGGTLAALRRSPLPNPVAIGLAILAVVHLAGGLIPVHGDVLYNAAFGWRAVRYDHFVHASSVFLGTAVLWWTIVLPAGPVQPPRLLGLCVLAALGLGALNEMVEFLITITHHGSHVGGYVNTGWDLVSNTVGALASALLLHLTAGKRATT